MNERKIKAVLILEIYVVALLVSVLLLELKRKILSVFNIVITCTYFYEKKKKRKNNKSTHFSFGYLKLGHKFTVYSLFVDIVWPRDVFALWGLVWGMPDMNYQHSVYLTCLVCCWFISKVKIRCGKSLKYVMQTWIQFCIPSSKI